ncbi:MAG: MmgE/PrpD family protein [Rhodoferax sp.]|nr:MmgE/PrpD family protein [Rhodoferax sp.]MBP9930660.1 MmgE/PrpD family protein [Rhodoferax sp.]HQX61224.1 MmgE/PrpD family protein [Burkholderiaceae bacterium]HQZ07669.1 MmgE/PrpD family protein [Burkholderiaceae bacterium]
MTPIEQLSRFAAAISFAELPAEVRDQTGWILADSMGAIVAGSAEPEMQALSGRLSGSGDCTVPGLGRTASADVAALLNGTAGTFLEMDEGNRFSRGHPAIHAIPAALALCEQRAGDAQAFLSALVVGYEVGSRIGAASRLRASMHPHGTWGTIGAAAACARLAGLDAAAMRETINIGASMTTATSKRTMLEGGLVRNVYAGLSNRNGLLALQLAESGFTGEHDGVASLMGGIVSEHFDPAELLRGLGQQWHLTQNYFKLHSCCRFNHGTLDAIDKIAARGALPAPEQIRQVHVDSYAYAAELDDPAPRNTLAAKFSVPFAVATRIVNGSSALASFSWDAVRDTRVLELARRVTVREDPQMTLRLPLERPARVRIMLTDGSSLQGEVGVNRGDDALPYSRAELREKFMNLSTRVWPQAHAAQVLEATLGMAAGGTSFSAWTRLLRQPAR